MPTIDNERLVRAAAAFKRDASKEFDRAVKALIDLVWAENAQSEDFLFESDPKIDAEANAILRGLSDSLAAAAKGRAEEIIRDSLGEYDEYDMEEDWEHADEEGSDGVLWRFDMQGSHLKELLEIWIALAVMYAIGKDELRVLVSRYLNNPYASPLWRGVPVKALRWGRGYAKNVLEQIVAIGQNAIFRAARFAEWVLARLRGARYYVRRRGSSYHCDECEEMANVPIPISTPFEVPHPRCCCWPEYFYGDMP